LNDQRRREGGNEQGREFLVCLQNESKKKEEHFLCSTPNLAPHISITEREKTFRGKRNRRNHDRKCGTQQKELSTRRSGKFPGDHSGETRGRKGKKRRRERGQNAYSRKVRGTTPEGGFQKTGGKGRGRLRGLLEEQQKETHESISEKTKRKKNSPGPKNGSGALPQKKNV